jgi:adenylate kinase family enzyme
MVIGVSSGVGKSTFAGKLGKALDIDVYHMDRLFWKPGWVESTTEELSLALQDIVLNQQWIIEGNYSNTFKVRTDHCDTIIYLELPLLICLFRVIKRWLTNIGQTRPDMAEGCQEKIDWDFVKFILTTYYPRKRKMEERLQKLELQGKKIIKLKCMREISRFILCDPRTSERYGTGNNVSK